jgi:hypothetical protein
MYFKIIFSDNEEHLFYFFLSDYFGSFYNNLIHFHLIDSDRIDKCNKKIMIGTVRDPDLFRIKN